MRAHEFITESAQEKLLPSQAGALPATYVIPELPNQDPYLQYRFSVAIAGAKGAEKRKQDGVSSMSREGPFGESEIVVSYGHDVGPYIDDALKSMGMKGKRRVSTPTSEETPDVTKTSPMKPFKGYKR
jgi:hypothetical protein